MPKAWRTDHGAVGRNRTYFSLYDRTDIERVIPTNTTSTYVLLIVFSEVTKTSVFNLLRNTFDALPTQVKEIS
jgi:hypothetical protein